MSTADFITELFYRIDDAMRGVRKHSQANLYPSELVTLGLLFAIKGVGERAFYRWVKGNYLDILSALARPHTLVPCFQGASRLDRSRFGRSNDSRRRGCLRN